MKHLKVIVEKINLKALFAPATIGAVRIIFSLIFFYFCYFSFISFYKENCYKQIAGLIIGLVPIFRKLLIVNNAPLAVIQDSIVMVG